MNTYIFICSDICGVGGFVQYLYNKIHFLENKGWRVLVFSGVRGNILVKELNKYNDFIYPELFYTPFYFTKRETRLIICQILTTIGENENKKCVIESNGFHSSIWAELIASRLRCSHFAFLVHEKHNYDSQMRKFLNFKYERHELAGISKKSLCQMLQDENVENRDDTQFSAFCSNVIEECDDDISRLLNYNAKYTLGCFGRLVKACVPSILVGFNCFIRNHPDDMINIVMIGGAQNQEEEKRMKEVIRQKLIFNNNVNLTFTGNIYPVPRSFLSKIDVFVSTGGAANATYIAGFPTVKVTPYGNPLGVVGLDYEYPEKNLYEVKANLTIKDCIEKAITKRSQIHFRDDLGKEYNIQMNKEFERQLSIVLSAKKCEYYEERCLMRLKTAYPSHHLEVWLLSHLFGANGTVYMKDFWKRLRYLIKKFVN